LGQDLEEKLGCEESHMGLVGSNDLLALIVHAVNIVFVPVVQLIHLPDKVISFISKSAKIILKPSLLTL